MATSRRQLNSAFLRWFGTLGRQWHISVSDVPRYLTLGWGEAANRTGQYTKIKELIQAPRLNVRDLGRELHNCYALMGQFDAIRLTRFLDKPAAASAVSQLLRDFPKSDSEAARRIERFLDRATALGFKNVNGKEDRPGAALLASILLTSAQPSCFLEFRQSRWSDFAASLERPLPKTDNYGEGMIQASAFGRTVCQTTTFQRHWPDQEPLWALAAICWVGTRGAKPEIPAMPEIDIVTDEDLVFPEGARREVIHTMLERNRSVVRDAKQRGLQRDKSLPCEVCGFSFFDTYGEHGAEFIEAHHRKPVSELARKSSPGTKVEDIALVCSNCHRMLHKGDRTLTMDGLRRMLKR